MLNLDEKQPALSIIDVFSAQMTKSVIDKMAENYIIFVKVPANMTRIFQPLDLTVNGSTKAFMKKRFTEWYSRRIVQELDSDKNVDSIDIQLNYLTSSEGREITSNGWKAAFIEEALTLFRMGFFGAAHGLGGQKGCPP